jgi:two-component system phosphate regulon sensor histidine kinase PhoR
MSGLDAMTLLDSLTSGAVITDGAGVIRVANPVFEEWYGRPVTGHALQDVLTLPDKTRCELCRGKKTSAEDAELFHNALLNDLRVKVKHSPLPDGQTLSLVDPFSEDAILTQAHGDFISTISHEFRTPLTSIKGFADTLLQYGNQLPEDEKNRFVTIIKEQADRLIRLVENLLTVSKLASGSLDSSYRPVPLYKMLERIIHSIQAKVRTKNPADAHRFNLVVHPASLEVWADADRLEQILLNLVDNAVKYSASDSTVSIRGELVPEDESRVRISVQDEGIGISEDALPKIFTQFYRVESPLKQEVEGTGLGLYITRSLTNALNGQLTVESTPGKGSTFTVTFPAATPERQAIYNRRLAAEDVRHA